ncbi:unnamed protein product [Darwinula stevensoni]|uniref:C-type lectin domain-containing protein n=1 Tax=Darwinula stevensoni TaxID=69355 RepID=A0A7R9FQW0_9CRUS|nr:unnamed protein product [Darwinula stevensoni]CAG0900482.1 unnamed protein product [Darwinula stevensoni]
MKFDMPQLLCDTGGGFLICRFGYRYEEPRTADAGSQLFYREPSGYNLVPGTGSEVKLTLKRGTAITAVAACQNDGAQLVSSSNAAMDSYAKQPLETAAPYTWIWLGGQNVTDSYHWVFPDGTTLNVTGPGQSYFCPQSPDGYSFCLEQHHSGCWHTYRCNGIDPGYLCEIKLPN